MNKPAWLAGNNFRLVQVGGEFFLQPCQLVLQARVVDHIVHLNDKPADQGGVHFNGEFHMFKPNLADLDLLFADQPAARALIPKPK